MARTAPLPHFQPQAGFATPRHASRGTAFGPLRSVLATIGGAALWAVKGFYTGLLGAQQRRADRLVWQIAQSDPLLKAHLIALRKQAASEQ